MRCQDVRKTIAVPAGPTLPDSVSDHLVLCPPCAKWAESAAKLDRIWAATRPEEPSLEVFDAVWANVNARVESSSPRILPFEAARSRRRVWFAAGLAQAAALLAAFYLTPNPARLPDKGVNPPPALAIALRSDPITVGDDETLVIRIDSRSVEVTRLEEPSGALLLASNDDVPTGNDNEALNAFESMSE